MKLLPGRLDLLFQVYIPGCLVFAIFLLLNPKVWLAVSQLIYLAPLVSLLFLSQTKYYRRKLANFDNTISYGPGAWLWRFWTLQLVCWLNFLGIQQALKSLLKLPIASKQLGTQSSIMMAILVLLPLLSSILGARRNLAKQPSTLSALACLQQYYSVNADSSLTVISNTATRQAGLSCLGFSWVVLALWANQKILFLVGLQAPLPSALGLLTAGAIFLLSQSNVGQQWLRSLWVYRLANGYLVGVWLLGSLILVDLLWYICQPLQMLVNHNSLLLWWQGQQTNLLNLDLWQLLNWGYSMCLVTLAAFFTAQLSAGQRVFNILVAGLCNPLLVLGGALIFYGSTLPIALSKLTYLPLCSLILLLVYLNSHHYQRFMLATFPGRALQLHKPFPLLIVRRLQLVLILGLLAYFGKVIIFFATFLALTGGFIMYVLLPIYGLAFYKLR